MNSSAQNLQQKFEGSHPGGVGARIKLILLEILLKSTFPEVDSISS